MAQDHLSETSDFWTFADFEWTWGRMSKLSWIYMYYHKGPHECSKVSPNIQLLQQTVLHSLWLTFHGKDLLKLCYKTSRLELICRLQESYSVSKLIMC